MIKNITYIFIGLLLILSPHDAFSQTPDVVWAGVGFTGNWNDRHDNYPVTSSFFCEGGGSCGEGKQIEKWAREKINQSNGYPFRIRFGQIDEKSIDQIGLAVTISRETVMHEEIIVAGVKKFLENYSLSGSAIFFDLKSKKMIAAAPIITRYSQVYELMPNDAERYRIYKSMLSDNMLGLNFFNEISRKLAHTQLTTLPSQYIQIKKFEIDPNVPPVVSTAPDKNVFSSYLSSFFENRLLDESGISLIPNRVGHTIGNKIATKLPSGDMTIVLPEPGYTLDFKIHKLIYQKKANKLTDSLCWGGVLTLNVNKHLFGDEKIATIGLRDVNCATVDKGMTLDDYSEYQKLMMGLLDGLAQQFDTINKKWVKEKTLDKKQAKKMIKMLSNEFKSAML